VNHLVETPLDDAFRGAAKGAADEPQRKAG